MEYLENNENAVERLYGGVLLNPDEYEDASLDSFEVAILEKLSEGDEVSEGDEDESIVLQPSCNSGKAPVDCFEVAILEKLPEGDEDARPICNSGKCKKPRVPGGKVCQIHCCQAIDCSNNKRKWHCRGLCYPCMKKAETQCETEKCRNGKTVNQKHCKICVTKSNNKSGKRPRECA